MRPLDIWNLVSCLNQIHEVWQISKWSEGSLNVVISDCMVNWSSESTGGCLDSVRDAYSSRRIRLHVVFHLKIPLWWKYVRRYRSYEFSVRNNVITVIMYLIIQAGYSWMDYVWYRQSSSVLYQYKKNFWFSNLIDIVSKKTIESYDIIIWIQYRLPIWNGVLQRCVDDVRQIWLSKVRMRRYHSSLKSLRIKIDEEQFVVFFRLKFFEYISILLLDFFSSFDMGFRIISIRSKWWSWYKLVFLIWCNSIWEKKLRYVIAYEFCWMFVNYTNIFDEIFEWVYSDDSFSEHVIKAIIHIQRVDHMNLYKCVS